MMMSRVLLVLALSLVHGDQTNPFVYELPVADSSSATVDYNLLPLRQPGTDGVFTVQDALSADPNTATGHNYTYYFSMGAMPSEQWPEPCKAEIGFHGKEIVAFQVNNVGNRCVYLGQTSSDSPKASFLNEQDLVGGIVLKYGEGQSRTNKNLPRRSFTVQFACADQNIGSTVTAPVHEVTSGAYLLTLKSQYACPTACPLSQTGGAGVCNAHGFCAFDNGEVKGARCFCNTGWYDHGCTSSKKPSTTTDDDSSSDGTTTALVFVFLFVLVLVVGVSVMYVRVNKLTANQELKDRFLADESLQTDDDTRFITDDEL